MSTFGRVIAAIAGVLAMSGCTSIFVNEPPMTLIPYEVTGDGDVPWLDETTLACRNGYSVVTLTPDNPSHDIESRSDVYGPRYSVLMEGGSNGDINFTFVEGLPSGLVVQYSTGDNSASQRIAYELIHHAAENRIISRDGSIVSYENLTQVTICY